MVSWLPAASGLIIALGLMWINSGELKVARRRTRQYRRLYVQLIAKLSNLTDQANTLEPLLPFITDSKVVDYYERCLQSLEGLLAATIALPHFDDDLGPLKVAHILVNHSKGKFDRTSEAFRRIAKGKAPNYNKLFDGKATLQTLRGCYFCSKPYRRGTFATVRTKINGVSIEVLGCTVCRDELGRTRKTKVLYFVKNGQPVHWSQVPEYNPTENFWELNKHTKIYETPKLELIATSRPTELDS